MRKTTKAPETVNPSKDPNVRPSELEALERRRAEAEQALRESEALYRAVVENVTDGIAITVGTTRALVNKAFLGIHGLEDPSEVVGLPIDQFILPEHRQEVRDLALAVERGDLAKAIVEYKIQRLNGEIRTVQASVGHIYFKGERAVLAVLRDITEQKRAEEEIRKLNEALEQKISELNKSNRDLEAFNYSVSHDLRIPLMAIEGFSRRLLGHSGDELDPKGLQMLGLIRSNVERMEQLINDLLAYARLGRQELAMSAVSMEQVVREVVDELAAIHAGRKIELRMDRLPPGYCDESMIRQVFANLLSNAYKFTKYRDIARIEIGGLTEAGENRYWVKDNGVGFDQQDAEKIFGVFQRLHGSDQFEGTGIGLAIVKRIIELHRGRIWAEGKPDAGATFYFTLPADQEQAKG